VARASASSTPAICVAPAFVCCCSLKRTMFGYASSASTPTTAHTVITSIKVNPEEELR
jgi:hypothetical protein